MKHLRITKDVPREGLKAGDVVNFMDDAEADGHVAAENAVHVAHKRGEDGLIVSGEWVDVAPEAKE